MEERLLTTKEVAEWLGVTGESIRKYRQLKDNPIPFIKLGGAVRFRREAVEAWLAEREKA